MTAKKRKSNPKRSAKKPAARKSKSDAGTSHEQRGDKLLSAGKPKLAIEEYRKVLESNPNHKGIYDKLLKAHDELPGEWKMEDFAESVTWTMMKQEQEFPHMKQVHARLSPDWKKATELALEIIHITDEKIVQKTIEELVGMGEIATRAMIGLLMDLKKLGKPQME